MSPMILVESPLLMSTSSITISIFSPLRLMLPFIIDDGMFLATMNVLVWLVVAVPVVPQLCWNACA